MSRAKCGVPPVSCRNNYKYMEGVDCMSDDEAEPYIEPINCSDDDKDYLEPIARPPDTEVLGLVRTGQGRHPVEYLESGEALSKLRERMRAKMPISSDKFTDARQVPPVPDDNIAPPLPQRKPRMVPSVVRMPAAPLPVTPLPPPPVTPVPPPPRVTPKSEPRSPAPPPSPPSRITPPPPREPKPKKSDATQIQWPPRKPSVEEPISPVHPGRKLPATPPPVSPTTRNPVAMESRHHPPPPLPPSRNATSPGGARPAEIQNGSDDPAAPLPPRKPPHLNLATQTHTPPKSQEEELLSNTDPKPVKPIIFVKKLNSTSSVTSEPPVTSPVSTRPGIDRIKTPLPPVPRDKEKEDLYYYDWYFSDVNREKSQKMVKDEHVDGVFLVRNSTHKDNPYTLCLYYENRHWNLHIRRRPDQKYSLGVEKPNEKTFRSVPEIIEYYKRKPIDLIGSSSGKALLTRAPTKVSLQ